MVSKMNLHDQKLTKTYFQKSEKRSQVNQKTSEQNFGNFTKRKFICYPNMFLFYTKAVKFAGIPVGL